MIEPCLSNIIHGHKEEWKIQLTRRINFISFKDSNEPYAMYIRSKNIVILTGHETDEIIDKLFEYLLQKCQDGLEEK